jgi:hypothetical protein
MSVMAQTCNVSQGHHAAVAWPDLDFEAELRAPMS